SLEEANSILITKSVADKLFGKEDPLGKELIFNNKMPLKVSGVLKDIPSNSHIKINALISLKTLSKDFNELLTNGWFSVAAFTYILLQKNYNIQNLENKMPAFYEKYLPYFHKNFKAQIHFQQLKKIHLNSHLQFEAEDNSYFSAIYILAFIGLFLIMIASINYMNLSAARSLTRTKEVGIRKVLGADKSQIIKQFLTESILLTFLSLFVSLIIIELILPSFNNFTGKQIKLNFIKDPFLILFVILGTAFIGLISGSYPAFFLSKFHSIQILKDRFYNKPGKQYLRKILIVIQFSISIIMIFGTLIILKQLNFMETNQLGFNKENILAVSIQDTISSLKIASLKNEFIQNNFVKNVSYASGIPGGTLGRTTFYTEGTNGFDNQLLPYIYADYDFINLMQIKIIEGRNFSKNISSDKNEAFIINETAAKNFGWKDPIGKEINMKKTDDNTYLIHGKVIGVVKDFHYSSFHNSIEPLIIRFSDEPLSTLETGFILAKISSSNVKNILDHFKEIWEKNYSSYPFEYFFLEENFNNQYKSEEKLSVLFSYFALIAICIACLGLFGLVSFTSEQRKKEIGIRKVLGATVSGIVSMLSKEFIKLVLIANFIAWPLAYYAMNKWLEDFAYRININIWSFLLAGLAAFIIALLTVAYQAMKAAWANPVKSIRYE
ncbi:MAG: FtsX-like permease family protein, partial [Ignavibacteriaceae bacterium]